MKLTSYKNKRKFDKTPEPKGKVGKPRKSRMFVVQKHAASHLHYDFRLEIDGVLKSWAVPKGPCLDPKVKRLAVQVEDHPIEYGSFEGIIPKGNYGGGTVMLWDKGTWEEGPPSKDKHNAFYFKLKGKKLKGLWKLIRISDGPRNWLLIKAQDNDAIPQEDYDIIEEQDLSAVSQRSMDEISKSQEVWKDGRKNKWQSPQVVPPDIKKLKKSSLLAKIKPQLATLVDKVPIGEDWLHEMKWDGYRLMSVIDKKVKLITRNGLDWTSDFPSIEAEMNQLNLKKTILDGEVVVLDEKGKPSFQLLQNALNEKTKDPMIYYLFDIIYYEGHNLSEVPLIERKALLEKIIPVGNEVLHYSDHIIGHGEKVFKKACKYGLEGIISKKVQSTYMQKRTESWLKIKSQKRQEFVVGGYTQGKGQRSFFGSLLLGFYDKKEFKYCGRVGTGFNDRSLEEIYELLEHYQTKKCPFSHKPPMQDFKSWVEPKMIVEVEYTEMTSEGVLRHPSFKGLREDKTPPEVVKEVGSDFKFEITHPGRIVYPKSNITKLDVVKYYDTIQSWILPYIVSRPLTIVRCPQGIEAACFFQKHILPHENNADIFQGDKSLYIKKQAGLMELVQIGALELHISGNQIDKPNKPDWIVFDLDPGEGVSWKTIVKTAFFIKEELERYGLTSFVKTTGGKGLHVVLPIVRRYDWESISLFTKTFSEYMSVKYPNDYVSVMTKSKRIHKIYIDYLRNQTGATAIAPYSTRARELATVSTPLGWDELSTKIKPSDFTIETVIKRLETLTQDPWEDFFAMKQSLPKMPKK